MSTMNTLIADLEAIPLADMTKRDQLTFAAAIGHLRRLSDRVHMLEIGQHRTAEKLNELERENARLKTPEWFYNADDGEYTYGDVNDVAEDMDHEGLMRVGGAREVWKKWAAVRCVALDADGDVDETEIHTFDTEAEALRCWPESFAAARAARAALAGSGEP
jgi:hypothetical protein